MIILICIPLCQNLLISALLEVGQRTLLHMMAKWPFFMMVMRLPIVMPRFKLLLMS